MEFNLVSLFLYLLVAAVAGGIARAIVGVARAGCLVSIAVGFIGALLGPWLANKAGLPEPFPIRFSGGVEFPFLWSVIGACLFLAVMVLVSGGRRRD